MGRMKDRPRLLLLSAIIATVILFCGCSAERYGSGSRPAGYARVEEMNLPREIPANLLPWEVWPANRLLTGSPIRSSDLLVAEKALTEGNRKEALDAYKKAAKVKRVPEEQELIVYRVASLQLALGQPKEAIGTMSRFFKALGEDESGVDPRFALVFGYAYGADHQLDQSIAWFLRAREGRPRIAALEQSAENGVRDLFRSMTDEQLDAVGSAWRSDSFVYGLAGEERELRSRPEYAAHTGSQAPFWEKPVQKSAPAAAVASNKSIVGAILPLSGPFAPLGNAAKQGIELAYMGKPVTLLFRDDGVKGAGADIATRELYGQGASFVFGPLITESAALSASVAREVRLPLLAFAKGSEFTPGDGVYRLGPTVASQVGSLMNAVYQQLGYRRIAIVYPDDIAGQEFALRFKDELARLNLQPVLERSYRKGDTGAFLAIAQEVDQLTPDAVFFPDSPTMASRFFSNLRHRARPLGTASWDNSNELQQSRTVLEGAIFVSPFYARSERSEVQQFIASYQAKYGQKPDFLAAQGFDAAMLVQEAARRAGNESLGGALETITAYDGLTGLARVEGSGEVVRTFSVISLEGGNLKELPSAPVLTAGGTEPAPVSDGQRYDEKKTQFTSQTWQGY